MRPRPGWLIAAVLLPGPTCGQDLIDVWREPLRDGLRVELRPDESEPAYRPQAPLRVDLMADPDDTRVEIEDVPFEWQLRLRAAATPRVPSVLEQGGVDIQYCPRYLPDLYPEATIGQMCSKDLLESPFLDQGEVGGNIFRTAFAEIDQMEENHTDIAIKAAIAAMYYYQNRDSSGAIDGALRTFLTEESVGLYNNLTNLVAPAVLDFLPSEISGLPPYEGFGPAIDLRVTTQATYKSVNDVEGMLRTAAERGLTGVAITDLDSTAGFDQAVVVADRLKREGLLPEGFVLIRGQEVHTLSGPLIGLFITDRVQRGMTMRAAIHDIHKQGGVAIIADPGTESGTKFVRTLPVDGYLLRTQPGSVFRTLGLMEAGQLLDKPLLAASGARAHSMVGVPYTVAETPDPSYEGIRRALRGHTAFGATNIQMPILSALVFRPFVPYEKAFGSWFRMRDEVETKLQRLIGADNVEIRTTYDPPLASMLGLVQAPNIISGLLGGTSPLTRTPDILRVSADYSYVRLEWDARDRELRMHGAIRW